MLLALKECRSKLSIGYTGTVSDSTRWDAESGYVEKKVNLLDSVVELITRVRSLPTHTTLETLGQWSEHAHVDQYWIRRTPEKGSYETEPEKYWVNSMFTPDHKIIPTNNLILLFHIFTP